MTSLVMILVTQFLFEPFGYAGMFILSGCIGVIGKYAHHFKPTFNDILVLHLFIQACSPCFSYQRD